MAIKRDNKIGVSVRGSNRASRRAARAIARLLRFKDDEKGATAIEFGIVALPFTFLVISIIQLSLIFLLYSTLENALNSTARGVRTGSNVPANASAFVTATCNGMGWLSAMCATQLSVDVRSEAQFTNPTEPDPTTGGTFKASALTYGTCAPGAICLVRAFFQWPVIAPVMDAALLKDGNNAVIVATTTFVVEPYS